MGGFEERSTYFINFSVTIGCLIQDSVDDKNGFEVLLVALSKNTVDLRSDGSCFEFKPCGHLQSMMYIKLENSVPFFRLAPRRGWAAANRFVVLAS